MALNEFNTRDYLEDMRSKVTFAFEDAPVFDRYLQIAAKPAMELQAVYKDLMQQRSVDTAVGAQLDIIGDIVGQPRELVDAELLPYFGFEGVPEVQSFGDVNNPSVGGYYWDIQKSLSGNVLLNDDQYRLFIRAKIIKNLTRATPEDVIYFIKFVFQVEHIEIQIDSGAQALILVSDDLNLFERTLLKYFITKQYRSYFVPKTLGVNYDFGIYSAVERFTYAGVPDGKGFGSLINDEVVGGGQYASIY